MLYMGCEGWSLVLGKNVPESGVQSHHPMEQHGGGGGGRKGWGTKHRWPGRSGVEKETVLFPLGYKKEKQKNNRKLYCSL